MSDEESKRHLPVDFFHWFSLWGFNAHVLPGGAPSPLGQPWRKSDIMPHGWHFELGNMGQEEPQLL